jgi:hypothetical protein
LLPAGGLGVDVGHPHHRVLGEQRGEAVVVAHHHGVGVLAAQRLDLDTVAEVLTIVHRFLLCLCAVLCATGGPRVCRQPRGRRE